MADKKKQSADEIVDSMAEEMGVKGEKPDESTDDLASDLGGIFGVSSKKKKKKKPAPEPEPVAEEEEDEVEEDEEQEEQEEQEVAEEEDESAPEEDEAEVEEEVAEIKPSPKAKAAAKKKPAPKNPEADKPKKKKHDLDGVFATGKSSDADVDYSSSSSYLDEDDLGGAVPGGGNKALIGVIVVLVVALIGVVLMVTPIGKDLKLLFTGDLNATRDAEVRKIEEAFKTAQEEALAKYGNLVITGNPVYATIKLNGEQHYAQTSKGIWREVQLKPGVSNFNGLPVKEKQIIEVSAPAHDTKTFELTQGKWQNSGGAFGFNYVATLTPKSEWDRMEFDARLSSDTENEYFGTVTLNSVPSGATVRFNNKPLLDKDGNVLKTPATFSSVWVKDEKSGKLEEVQVKVDTVLDQGHKVEVFMEGAADMPHYGMQLQRQMWECVKKDEDAIKKLAKDHTIQHECDYTFTKTVDLNAIKAYGEKRDAEEKRVTEFNERVKDIQARIQNREPVTQAEIDELQKR